jgi:hypothetical protein
MQIAFLLHNILPTMLVPGVASYQLCCTIQFAAVMPGRNMLTCCAKMLSACLGECDLSFRLKWHSLTPWKSRFVFKPCCYYYFISSMLCLCHPQSSSSFDSMLNPVFVCIELHCALRTKNESCKVKAKRRMWTKLKYVCLCSHLWICYYSLKCASLLASNENSFMFRHYCLIPSSTIASSTYSPTKYCLRDPWSIF